MENKLTESEIIDYLYGNLSQQAQKSVEEILEGDPKLRAEVDDLKQLMGLMAQVEDKEVIPPAFVIDSMETKVVSFWETGFFRRTVSIAASISLIIAAAYFTGFGVSYTEQRLSMGFNMKHQDVNKEDIQSWMKEAMVEYNQATDRRINEVEKDLTAQITSTEERNLDSMKGILSSYTANSQGVMRKYVTQVNKENLEMIQDFFLVSSEKQQAYLKAVLADYNSFYQDQREFDLKMIETGLNHMQSKNKVKQYETDQLLANLMDIVKTQNK